MVWAASFGPKGRGVVGPPVMTVMPSRKRPTPPRSEIAVDIPLPGPNQRSAIRLRLAYCVKGAPRQLVAALSHPNSGLPEFGTL